MPVAMTSSNMSSAEKSARVLYTYSLQWEVPEHARRSLRLNVQQLYFDSECVSECYNNSRYDNKIAAWLLRAEYLRTALKLSPGSMSVLMYEKRLLAAHGMQGSEQLYSTLANRKPLLKNDLTHH
eukprot:8437-Heterococcus_DN1.PRE.3